SSRRHTRFSCDWSSDVCSSDLAEELGVTANKVGKIANAHGLKTPEYGITVLDKSRYSDKQVPNFRYNEKGRQKPIELVKGGGVRSEERRVGKECRSQETPQRGT